MPPSPQEQRDGMLRGVRHSRRFKPSRDTSMSESSREQSYEDEDYLDEDLLENPVSNGHPIPEEHQATASRSNNRTVSQNQRFVLALDYGTTFTGLSYTTIDSDQADLSKLKVLVDWTPKMSNQPKVPSVISYERTSQGEAQWGLDLSENAITMVNTKLELEPLTTRLAELELALRVLKGTHNLAFEYVRRVGSDPAYTTKPPVGIIADYLTKVFECSRKEIKIDKLVLTQTPVDMVVTVPVNWSYEARNSIFKAIRQAGFNRSIFPTLHDTIMVSEPEAASYFTARYLQLHRQTELLKENQCFILVDAGGGTVDTVSYQVKKLYPSLELQIVSRPTGDQFGSSLIDWEFKHWLRDQIGREYYRTLDPANADQQRISPHTAESGNMRVLIKRFNVEKSVFSNDQKSDIKIDLPPPLDNLNLETRVTQGELTIHWDEMRGLMKRCVNGVIKLIKDQKETLQREKGLRAKKVFLVGGFGASPYLREELEKSVLKRELGLERPDADQSLTAVVQGAVIYGIEKARHDNAHYTASILQDYGVLNNTGFEWLLRRGDLVSSNQEATKTSKIFYYPAKSCKDGKGIFPIYKYLSEDDYVPENYQAGQYEVEEVGRIKCNFASYMGRDHRPVPGTLVPGNLYNARSGTDFGPLTWQLKFKGSTIVAEILFGERNTCIGRCEIRLEADWRDNFRHESQWWNGNG